MVFVEPGDIAELIETGQFEEGVELEAKRAGGAIPRNAWESISAFANTLGGALVLGLAESEDGWRAEGVSDPDRTIQELHSLMRDRGKISFEVSGNSDIWKEEVDARQLVIVRVRAAPRRHKPVFINGNRDTGFVRRNEGDARCSEEELHRMRREAMPSTFDSQVIPFLRLEDFDVETIDRYGAMSSEVRPDLAHHRLEAEEFLRSVGAWRVDRERDTEGPTVAGLLMFGQEPAIREIRTNHVIDYRRIPVDETPTRRWTDRVRWTGNLFGAWEQKIFPRLLRGLPTPFRLRGPQRLDQPAGLEALREAFVNLLVHTDYQESSDAVILHRDDGYGFRNPGDSWVDPQDLGIQGRSERRKPVIAQLFDNIGLADQAGSGFIRILDEWRELGYRKPNIVSDPSAYQFELDLKLAGMLSARDRKWLGEIGGPWREDEELALVFARHEGFVDNQTLRSATGQHLFDASQTLRSLRNRDFLVLRGSGRHSSYVLGTAAIDSTDHLDESSDHLDHRDDQTWIDSEIKRIAGPISRTGKSSSEEVETAIVGLCALTPMSTDDLVKILNRRLVTVRRYVRHLVASGELEPIFPQAQHPNQRYRATLKPLETATQTKMPL